MRALVIDDSLAIRKWLGRRMTAMGFDEVYEAENGSEAIRKLAEIGSVDVALVDWTMPVMDGLSFVKAIRSDPDYGNVRVVMVTSENAPAQIYQAIEAGADEYITKPVTPDALAEKLLLVGFEVG